MATISIFEFVQLKPDGMSLAPKPEGKLGGRPTLALFDVRRSVKADDITESWRIKCGTQ